MSANELIYNLGVTQIVVGSSLSLQVFPPRCTKSVTVKIASGTSLQILNGPTLAAGYVLGSTEVMSMGGPASFFLGAAGGTAIAAVIFGLSAGYSLTP